MRCGSGYGSCGDTTASTLKRRSAVSCPFRNDSTSSLMRRNSVIGFPQQPYSVPTYEYCNPYMESFPYGSISECYECLTQNQNAAALIYASPSILSPSLYGSTLGCGTSSSIYSGIYGNKFGLSKKGLLQIDYSCSWNDLDRVIGRNY